MHITLDTLAGIALAEAGGLTVPRRLVTRTVAVQELRARVDSRDWLPSGCREAGGRRQTCCARRALVRSYRSSIEDLTDRAEVERPDLARVTRDGTVVILLSDFERSTALNERTGDRAWSTNWCA